MKSLLRKKLSYKKNYKLKLWLILIIFLLLILISVIYLTYIRNLTLDNIYTSLNEIGTQNADKLNLIISNQKKYVSQMIDSITDANFQSPEQIFNRFKKDMEDYHFNRLAILDKNGNGITNDGLLISNYPKIEEFFAQDEVYLSENRPSVVSNFQVNIYSKKFSLFGREVVLFATIKTEEYKNILSKEVFNGKGGTYLINNNGDIIIDSFGVDTQTLVDNKNIFDINNTEILDEDININNINEMKNNIKNNLSGNFYIKTANNKYFINYEPIDTNNWYVVTIAPDTIIAKETNLFLLISFIVCILIIFIITSISIYIDVSNKKKNEKLYNLAYIDKITLLGNESFFKEKGDIYLKNAVKNKYIISLDINKFKALNNIYGYEFCSSILKVLAEKLINILPLDNITCRLGNDVFVSIFSYRQDINNFMDKIYTNISNITVNNENIHLNLAIGIYKITQEDNDINKVLDKATMARAKIKGQYDKNYYIFDDILESTLIDEQKIESSMEAAIKNHEFKVVYQPKTFVKNEKFAGAEALVRWYKDDKIIPPNKFIPLFEKNKFIIKLDLYMFECVCKDMAYWKEKYNFVPTISINVSKEHFIKEDFIEDYIKIVDKYKIDRKNIDLEITESATIEENIDTIKILQKIKDSGFIVSIDDFGTGYSSLSMLQSMPIDIIKIDKVFIDKANLNSDKNIINYIMSIAKHLGVKTITEGVEKKEQVDFLKKLKCDMIQGYYYSKPIQKKEFEEYFNKNR